MHSRDLETGETMEIDPGAMRDSYRDHIEQLNVFNTNGLSTPIVSEARPSRICARPFRSQRGSSGGGAFRVLRPFGRGLTHSAAEAVAEMVRVVVSRGSGGFLDRQARGDDQVPRALESQPFGESHG